MINFIEIKGWTWHSPHRPLYKLTENYTHFTGIDETFLGKGYLHSGGILHLYKNKYIWDGASGGIDYKFMESSAVHDALCDAINRKVLQSKYQSTADKLMRDINLKNQFAPRAYLNWLGVRLFQSVHRWQQKKRGLVL